MGFKTSEWIQPSDNDGGVFDPMPIPDLQLEMLEIAEAEKDAKREEARRKKAAQREAIRMRLYDEDRPDLGNKLAHCGLPMPLVCVCCGVGKVVETRCKRRWCPACAWSIQMARVDRFKGAVALMQWPLFLTLTQQNSADPETIRDLRKSWGKMRRRKLIKDKIAGGVAAIEVTNSGQGWHPHLHAIVDCEWLAVHTPAPKSRESVFAKREKYDYARSELSSIWADVIGQPQAIVLAIRARGDAAAVYLLKYCTKGEDLIRCPDDIGPLIDVLDKSRLISAFGNLHGRTAEMDGGENQGLACNGCGQEKSFVPMAVIEHCRSRDEPGKNIPVHFGTNFKPAL